MAPKPRSRNKKQNGCYPRYPQAKHGASVVQITSEVDQHHYNYNQAGFANQQHLNPNSPFYPPSHPNPSMLAPSHDPRFMHYPPGHMYPLLGVESSEAMLMPLPHEDGYTPMAHQGRQAHIGEIPPPRYFSDNMGDGPVRIFRPIPGFSVAHNLEGMLSAIDSSLRSEFKLRRTPVVGEAIDRMLVVFELLQMERNGHGHDLVTVPGVAGIDSTKNEHMKTTNGWCQRLWNISSGVRWMETETLAAMNAAWLRERAAIAEAERSNAAAPETAASQASQSVFRHNVRILSKPKGKVRVQKTLDTSSKEDTDATVDTISSSLGAGLDVSIPFTPLKMSPAEGSTQLDACGDEEGQTPTPPASISAVEGATEFHKARVCFPTKINSIAPSKASSSQHGDNDSGVEQIIQSTEAYRSGSARSKKPRMEVKEE